MVRFCSFFVLLALASAVEGRSGCVFESPRCVPFIPASIVHRAGAPRAHQHRPGDHSRGHGFGQRGWKRGKRAHLPSGTCSAWQTVSAVRSTHPLRTHSARSDRRRMRVTVVIMCPHPMTNALWGVETTVLTVPRSTSDVRRRTEAV